MALTDGVNCGFVSTAPTADPAASSAPAQGRHIMVKFTSPAGSNKATELGWWLENVPTDFQWEMAIYTHDGGTDLPDVILGSKITDTADGGADRWVTGAVDIVLVASTTYWLVIATELIGGPDYNFQTTGGVKLGVESGNAAPLDDPYTGSPSTFADHLAALYAQFEAVGEAAPPLKRFNYAPYLVR